MVILVLNCGSSSVKYQVVELPTERQLAEGTLERVRDPGEAIATVLERTAGFAIDAVGHRVVHGGPDLHCSVLIDDAVLASIEACVPLAPLHNPANLAGIRAVQAVRPSLPQVAVFDTAFHARLPRRAQTYALPRSLRDERGYRRFGFHGTSHADAAERAAACMGRPVRELRLICLHLGNGASACAVEYGHSVETSMGLTPMEGLVMGTRSGDVDPGLVLALLRDGMEVEAVDRLLNRQSGLLGLSGRSADLRDIDQGASEGDDACRLAINVFAHRVRKYVGAYAAVMGGLDGVVLTAGIGEHSASMRQRILQRLEFLGVVLDEEKNLDVRVDAHDPHLPRAAAIHAVNSRVAVVVVAADEEGAIARQTRRVVEEAHVAGDVQPIPIAVSARHLHLTPETFAQLFGPDASPTKLRDISQPGQFACEEKVNLIGPRDRIDGVRLLGPFRRSDQVEISRTDEFRLGIDAPVRDSGHTEGSAPIVLEGPHGRVALTEGLICARRHIHMTPEDAKRHGVSDHDEVEVAITGGERDLVFGDVLIRVSDRYKLEMHIDTDEANAAELSGNQVGHLVYEDVLTATAGIVAKRAQRR